MKHRCGRVLGCLHGFDNDDGVIGGHRIARLTHRASYGVLVLLCVLAAGRARAQSEPEKIIDPIVVSVSRAAQARFDAPAAIDVVTVDPSRATSPLVNLAELLSAVPGLQIRDRQNFAQDVQISVRGFGTRSSFGVRGVRILVDGIPATMPDGQGQAATADLAAVARVEVLRGPLAQLYGNAAGGVVQIFTGDPPRGGAPAFARVSVGAGSYGQRQVGSALGGGNDVLGATVDVSHFSTDGYRDHSAAERLQLAGKVVGHPTAVTTVTATVNYFNQPKAQDPLGLTHAVFEQAPTQTTAAALMFDTRKKITQQQVGVTVLHQVSQLDTVQARLYGGSRQVFQTLATSGASLTSAGGVVDLDRAYAGIGVNWHHQPHADQIPLGWTVGVESDTLREQRRGFVNDAGGIGALRRDETDSARNSDFFGQLDWRFAPQWRVIAGARSSHVRLAVDDHASGAINSGQVNYRNVSPVAGLLWHATDDINLYANAGRGFETPTLAESAYRAGAAGPNLNLQASTSKQAEVGLKFQRKSHAIDVALFHSRSANEIVPFLVSNGRTIFQNVDGVQRRGVEAAWRMQTEKVATLVSYTWLDARFRAPFATAQNQRVEAGNRLPGAPQHSLFSEAEVRFDHAFSAALEFRAESRVLVNDINSDAAPGYGVVNTRFGKDFSTPLAQLFLFGRVDNMLGHRYAGSVIVNDGNGRYFEPAPDRRLFIGVRAAL